MSVRVVARIRPLLKQEIEKDVIVTPSSSDQTNTQNLIRIPNPKNHAELYSFQFNSVYDQHAVQQEIFESEGTTGNKQPAHVFMLTVQSCADGQTSLQGVRCYDFCIWSNWHRQDAHDARWEITGGSGRHPAYAERRIPTGTENGKGVGWRDKR
jgi:hypothetical protein